MVVGTVADRVNLAQSAAIHVGGLQPQAESVMSSIVSFSFNSNQLRVVKDDDGEAFFVAKDVATLLGYAKPGNAISQHCANPKYLKDMWALIQGQQNQSLMIGIHAETVMIPEPDVYRLVMRSNLDSAVRFQDWVFEEVLPQIRKTGFYADLNQSLTKRTPEEITKGLLDLAKEVRRSLPKFASHASLVTDTCVFVQKSAGQRTSFDGTHDEIAYGKAMDARGLPGITIDESDPITVTFDWHANHAVPDDVVGNLYAMLARKCMAYRGGSPKSKPFVDGLDFETITGFGSTHEARDLANTIAKMSREFLVERAIAA